MSDFETPQGIEKLLERNPGVDQGQLREAAKALSALRRAGIAGPSYKIDSPYERGPAQGPESAAHDREHEALP